MEKLAKQLDLMIKLTLESRRSSTPVFQITVSACVRLYFLTLDIFLVVETSSEKKTHNLIIALNI